MMDLRVFRVQYAQMAPGADISERNSMWEDNAGTLKLLGLL